MKPTCELLIENLIPIRVTKNKILRQMTNVAHVEGKLFVEKTKGKRTAAKPSHRRENNRKLDVTKLLVKLWTGTKWLRTVLWEIFLKYMRNF
jgi:hypothetical protein